MAVLAILPFFLGAQFNISGNVRDAESGEALSGAHVIIDGAYSRAISGPEGSFKISGLKKGNYLLKISFVGYEEAKKEVQLENDVSLDVELNPSALTSETVFINASRADEQSPLTFTNLNMEAIEELNSVEDMPYIMEFTPSVVTSSDAGAGVGYSSIRIRGTDLTRINVTINGIPYNDPESHAVYWVDLPDFASSVQNLQIQRGVGTSSNGAAAFGASINIQTTNASPEPYAELHSGVGSFNTFRNTLKFGTGILKNKWAVDARLSHIKSEGYIDRAFADLQSFFLTATHYGKKSVLMFNVFGGKEKTYQAWYGVPSELLQTNRTYNPYTYENQTDNYLQNHYQLLYSKTLTDDLMFNLSGFLITGIGYYESYDDGAAFTTYGLDEFILVDQDTVYNSDVIQQKWLDNIFYGLNYSLEYKYKRGKAILGGGWNNYEGDHFGEVIWMQYNAGNTENHFQWYENTGEKNDFNIFLKSDYFITEKVKFFADVQFRRIDFSMDGLHDDFRDLTQEHEFNFVNPKTGLYFMPNDRHHFYVSFARSNREPSRNNYRDADNNYQPKAEKLNDFELGYTLRRKKSLINLNVFYMDYKDQLILTGEINNVGMPIMTNVDKSYRMGIELSGNVDMTDWLQWKLNYAFSTNKIMEFTEYVDDWDAWIQKEHNLGTVDMAFSPDHIFSSIIGFDLNKNFSFQILSKYVSSQFIDNTSSETRSLDPYLVNDARLVYKFVCKKNTSGRVYVKLNNLLDEDYETNAWVYRYIYEGAYQTMDGYFPQAGMNIFTGIILTFQ